MENSKRVMQFSIEIKNAGDAVTAVIALEQMEGIFEGRIKGQTLLVKSKLSYQDVIQKLQQSGIVAAFVQCTQSDGTLRSY